MVHVADDATAITALGVDERERLELLLVDLAGLEGERGGRGEDERGSELHGVLGSGLGYV